MNRKGSPKEATRRGVVKVKAPGIGTAGFGSWVHPGQPDFGVTLFSTHGHFSFPGDRTERKFVSAGSGAHPRADEQLGGGGPCHRFSPDARLRVTSPSLESPRLVGFFWGGGGLGWAWGGSLDLWLGGGSLGR